MTRIATISAGLAVLLGAAAWPVHAESSVSSAASNSASASVGSLSTSIEKSSASSSNKDDKVADGDYRILEITTAAARPDRLRLKLQALADAGPGGIVVLELPQQAVEQGALGAGLLVTARRRDYGIEFSRTESRQAFFLVVDDAWYRELQTRPVRL